MFLGVNTSGAQGQICLYSNDIAKDIKWEKKGSHSERITELFYELLNNNNIQLKSLKKIYCVTGPGSFTGIRVGINFCKTLAYSLSLPIVPISSLNLLSLNCTQIDRPIISALDAQKNSFYISEFQRNIDNIEVIRNHEIFKINSLSLLFDKPKYVCGDGFENILSLIDQKIKKNMIFENDRLHSDLFNFLKNEKLFNSIEVAWNDLQPSYLKLSAPEEKLKPTFSN